MLSKKHILTVDKSFCKNLSENSLELDQVEELYSLIGIVTTEILFI